MFTLIPHNTKDKESLPSKFGLDEVGHPAQVLVKTTSGYKILDLYVRDSTGTVFAKNGSYLIALMSNGITSNAKITWTELDGIEELYDKCNLSYFKVMN